MCILTKNFIRIWNTRSWMQHLTVEGRLNVSRIKVKPSLYMPEWHALNVDMRSSNIMSCKPAGTTSRSRQIQNCRQAPAAPYIKNPVVPFFGWRRGVGPAARLLYHRTVRPLYNVALHSTSFSDLSGPNSSTNRHCFMLVFPKRLIYNGCFWKSKIRDFLEN